MKKKQNKNKIKEKDETGVHDSLLYKLFWNQWLAMLGGEVFKSDCHSV